MNSIFSILFSSTLFCINSNAFELESPSVTNWGDWHHWDHCPNGMFATGMRLKVEPGQGVFEDDTSLNGIRLYCNYPGESSNYRYIESGSETWGAWGNEKMCSGGTSITGFQLRSEENQGPLDDSAANNLRIFCNGLTGSYIEGDGNTFGYWTSSRHCNYRQAVCGLSTQVEEEGHVDETSMNNIKVLCCNVPNPAKTCEPTDKWDKILSCDNTLGQKSKKCKYEQRTGISYSHDSPNPKKPFEREFYTNSGYILDTEMIENLQQNIQNKLGGQKTNTFDWSATSKNNFWTKEQAVVGEIEIPPHSYLTLYQASTDCGIFSINSNKLKKVLKNPLAKNDLVTYIDM